MCQTLINAFDGVELVGGSLLKHYYSVWDIRGQRMGFAPNGRGHRSYLLTIGLIVAAQGISDDRSQLFFFWQKDNLRLSIIARHCIFPSMYRCGNGNKPETI